MSMKKEGFKFLCKICSDGRLYNGAWYHESVLPEPLPNEVIFDEFPAEGQPEIGIGVDCSDYLWDGQTLTYSPAAQAEPAPVQTADDGSEVTYS